jgi:hypothetical protein
VKGKIGYVAADGTRKTEVCDDDGICPRLVKKSGERDKLGDLTVVYEGVEGDVYFYTVRVGKGNEAG